MIRDLDSGAGQRRGVLLTLVASARVINEGGRGGEDETIARGRNLLSSFGRLSAEVAAFEENAADKALIFSLGDTDMFLGVRVGGYCVEDVDEGGVGLRIGVIGEGRPFPTLDVRLL